MNLDKVHLKIGRKTPMVLNKHRQYRLNKKLFKSRKYLLDVEGLFQ